MKPLGSTFSEVQKVLNRIQKEIPSDCGVDFTVLGDGVYVMKYLKDGIYRSRPWITLDTKFADSDEEAIKWLESLPKMDTDEN